VEGKTQGKSARSLSGRQPEDKKPSMKGTPLMSTSKVPDLTMIHADIITLFTLAGVRKFLLQNFKCWCIKHPVEPSLSLT
jgi:hypothetical protein